jgi:hypothetical protein
MEQAFEFFLNLQQIIDARSSASSTEFILKLTIVVFGKWWQQ